MGSYLFGLQSDCFKGVSRMLSRIFKGFIATIMVFSLSINSLAVYIGSYDPNIDYSKAMYDCAELGDEYSMALGHIYELQRNMKLKDLGKEDEVTCYFSPEKTGKEIIIEMVSDQMKKDYRYSGYVYECLAKNGYSDVCIAGILGNMMNETGGNTLTLNPYVYESEYGMHYGLCQWSLIYHKDIDGADIQDQVAYLIKSMDGTFKLFEESEKDFKASETAEDAAEYFSKYYERGGNTKQRKKNAKEAYDWIISFKGEK